MTTNGKRVAQKAVAMILMVAILDVVGIAPGIILFFFAVGFFVWLVIQRTQRQQSRDVFQFYIAADEILRDEDRHWYGFEIAEVLDQGELVLCSMPDPPPLVFFVIGALHHRMGDYEAAIENLGCVVEEHLAEEHLRSAPSPRLRRYVETLRNIEREPAGAPQALASIRSLERMRRRAPSLLADSRERLQQGSHAAEGNQKAGNAAPNADRPLAGSADKPLSSIAPPRPITDVLHDVYQDEKKTA